MNDEVLAVIEASVPRRWLAVAMLTTVGLMVIYVALATPPTPGWQIFLIVIGAGALWTAQRLFRATAHRIELTDRELRSSTGICIARIDDIEGIDRGMFAFKPSNGFLLKTRTPGDRAWQPGLWWRMGRRVGIGGVTPGGQSKAMSEVIAALLMRRDQASDQAT